MMFTIIWVAIEPVAQILKVTELKKKKKKVNLSFKYNSKYTGH